MGLRDLAKAISPGFLQGTVGEKLIDVLALGMDALLEKLDQGMQLHMPGYGDPSALPFIGNDRLIGQGLSETSNEYALRLKAWLDSWRIAGSAHAVLQQLEGFFAIQQLFVRTVSDSGAWDTYLAGPWTPAMTPSATTGPAHYRNPISNWNWDNEADPHVPGKTAWWRWWLIMNPDLKPVGGGVASASNATPIVITTNTPHGLSNGQNVFVTGVAGNLAANSVSNGGGVGVLYGPWLVAGVTSTTFQIQSLAGVNTTGTGASSPGGTVYLVGPNGFGLGPGPACGGPGVMCGDPNISCGLNRPASLFQGMQALANQWKAAHSWLRWMIISFDPSLFDPFQPADGTHNPAGTFGPWAAPVSGNYVTTRFVNARYCDGAA